MTVRVVIADDQALVRAGLAGMIGTAPDLTVVGRAGTGREAIDLAKSHQPDVILMDVRMPDLNGIEATRLITAHSQTRVLILTTFDLDDYVYAALRGGASGFLLKDTSPTALLAAVRVVAAGDALLAPSVTRRLISRFATKQQQQPQPPDSQSPGPQSPGPQSPGPQSPGPQSPGPQSPGPQPSDPGQPSAVPSTADVLAGLTDRQQEVLLLVAEGLSNAEIAARLYITPGTAKIHVARLLAKLGARDRIQLVILAYRSGLVTAP
jgi:DNA-binding NarL/FixJ family response regulator